MRDNSGCRIQLPGLPQLSGLPELPGLPSYSDRNRSLDLLEWSVPLFVMYRTQRAATAHDEPAS